MKFLKEGYWQSKALAFFFLLCIALGQDLPGVWLADRTFGGLGKLIFYLLILYFLFEIAIDFFYKKLCSTGCKVRGEERKDRSGIIRCYFFSFLVMWTVYFIYFLNQYPGSLSCDTPQQLKQAAGLSAFENANPFINTFMISVFVRVGRILSDDINLGVGFYTLFQLTAAALIYAYVVTTVYQKGFHKAIAALTFFYFAFVPFNIVYAVGMWKDTFFSIFFLLTITYIWNVMEAAVVKRSQWILLGGLTVLTSLCRNSGWSALLFLVVFLVIHALKRDRKQLKLAGVIVTGILLNFFITSVLYPAVGVSGGGDIVTALSVPIQQISRVVAEGKELEAEEYQLLAGVVEVETVAEKYDETISDPMKHAVDEEALSANLGEYAKLWLSLGKRYPKCYLDAYLALTKNYWYPMASSWTWDTRIFENDLGVNRTPKLFKNHDLTNLFYKMYEFPRGSMLKNSSVSLWLILLSLGFASVRKNREGMLLYVPIIGIYAGLMFTSPVALFRYTYGAVICLPLMMCLPYWRSDV